MGTPHHPLLTRRAADLMTRDIVVVPKDMSVPGAAHLLAQADVSGAPVIDDQGRCIGVVSTTDFLHYSEKGHRPKMACAAATVHSWQIVADDEPVEERVADIMTYDPVTAPPATPVADLARMMMEAHIHRVIIVDQHHRPLGVVSSTNILAAVAQAGLGQKA